MRKYKPQASYSTSLNSISKHFQEKTQKNLIYSYCTLETLAEKNLSAQFFFNCHANSTANHLNGKEWQNYRKKKEEIRAYRGDSFQSRSCSSSMVPFAPPPFWSPIEGDSQTGASATLEIPHGYKCWGEWNIRRNNWGRLG